MSEGIAPKIRERFDMLSQAASGDVVIAIYPETVNRAATAAAWSRKVTIQLENAAGDVHTWFSDTIATKLSVGDTSVAGTATIPSTSIVFEDGIATTTVSGDAAAWLAAETDTLTVASLTIYGETITGGTSVQTFV
jgi:anti-sigma factor RsiW